MEMQEIKRWTDEVLTPILSGNQVTSEVERINGGLALLSADADKIKEYVFESTKLPEIRGASQIVRDLTEGDGARSLQTILRHRGLPDECVVYAGGGSLLAIVPQTIAQMNLPTDICREMEEVYARETGAATLTATWLPESSATLAEAFGERAKAAGYMLRRRKESRNAGPLFEVSPLARRCASCGVRPASDRDPRQNVDVRYLCSVCIRKIEQSGEIGEGKREYFMRFEKHVRPDDHYLENRPEGMKGLKGARDLAEIAEGDRESLVGLIYADGDGVGDKLLKTQRLGDYQQKSQTLKKVMYQVVFGALAGHLQPVDGRHPFEVITIGGDDVLLIVPASVALPIALEICERFQAELSKEGWEAAPTMSAGVIIAHQHNPIRFMRELAEQLLKSAKKRAHREQMGTVDFAVLKSQSMVAANVETLREQVYSYAIADREHVYITGRPFTLDELRRLLEEARLLKAVGFPRSQSQALREVFRDAGRRGRLWPWLYYHRQKQRMSGLHKALLDKIESDWLSGRTVADDLWPWLALPRRGRWARFKSVWEDLHEARELLPEVEPPSVSLDVKAALQSLRERVAQKEAERES